MTENKNIQSYASINSMLFELDYRILHAGYQSGINEVPIGKHIDRYVLNYMTGGECEYIVKNKKYILHKGDLFLNFPAIDFVQKPTKGSTNQFYYIALNSPDMESILMKCGLTTNNPVLNICEPKLEKLFSMIPKTLKTNSVLSLAKTKLIMDKIFYILLERVEDNKKHIETKQLALVNNAITYMQENCQNPITIKDIAFAIGIHRCYLSTIFKNVKSENIKTYLSHLRLTKAARLLQDSTLSISKISEVSGFSDYANFYKAFHAHFGRSPQYYRQELKKDQAKTEKSETAFTTISKPTQKK